MILDTTQRMELENLIRERLEAFVGKIASGVAQTTALSRPSAINLIAKVQRNADDPRLIEVLLQKKIKHPKAKFSDATAWDEVETLISYNVEEVPGQLKIMQN